MTQGTIRVGFWLIAMSRQGLLEMLESKAEPSGETPHSWGVKPPLCTSLHIILETLGDMTQLWVLHALHAEHMWQEPMIKISKWYCGFSQLTGARHGKTMKMKGQVSQKRLRPESMAVHGRVKTQDRKQNLVCSNCRFNHDNRMIRLENYIWGFL